MIKTNYREILEFVAKNIGTTLLVDMEPYGLSTAFFDGCKFKIGTDGLMREIGYGDFEEEACEEYFQMLQGKTLIFPIKGETEYSFDEEFEKYRAYKKEELERYISLEEYMNLTKLEALFAREIIEVFDIEVKTIKGHSLYVLYSNDIYYAYEETCPELKELRTGDVIRIWYYTEKVSNYGNVIRKMDIINHY